MNKLHEELYVLEAGDCSEHLLNDLEIAPERGLSEEQKKLTLECYARGCGDPSDFPHSAITQKVVKMSSVFQVSLSSL